MVKDTSTSFEVNNNFTDNLQDASTSEGVTDNAVYTVQKGDSIYSIVSYFGVTVSTIMTFNHKDVKTVHVGEVLEVPSVSGVLYTIAKGDTLAGVSKKYNVDPDDVSLYNGLLSGDDLAVGDEVFLPGAKDLVADVVSVKKSGGKSGDNSKTGKNISIKIKL